MIVTGGIAPKREGACPLVSGASEPTGLDAKRASAEAIRAAMAA